MSWLGWVIVGARLAVPFLTRCASVGARLCHALVGLGHRRGTACRALFPRRGWGEPHPYVVLGQGKPCPYISFGRGKPRAYVGQGKLTSANGVAPGHGFLEDCRRFVGWNDRPDREIKEH